MLTGIHERVADAAGPQRASALVQYLSEACWRGAQEVGAVAARLPDSNEQNLQ